MLDAVRQDRRWQGPRLALAVLAAVTLMPVGAAGFVAAPGAVRKVLTTLALLIAGPLIVRERRMLAEIAAGGRTDGLIYALAWLHALLGGALVTAAGVARVLAVIVHSAGSSSRVAVYAAFCVTIIVVLCIVGARAVSRERRQPQLPPTQRSD